MKSLIQLLPASLISPKGTGNALPNSKNLLRFSEIGIDSRSVSEPDHGFKLRECYEILEKQASCSGLENHGILMQNRRKAEFGPKLAPACSRGH
jgi:hypothetical protein